MGEGLDGVYVVVDNAEIGGPHIGLGGIILRVTYMIQMNERVQQMSNSKHSKWFKSLDFLNDIL